MDIENLKRIHWTKIWAGTWSFLSCSHFGKEYTQLLRFGDRPFMSKVVILISDNKSHCWAPEEDRDRLGAFLAHEVANNPARADEVCQSLKAGTDRIMSFIASAIEKPIDAKTYDQFWKEVVAYYPPHIYVKYVVDYLTPELLEKYLPQFEDARVYCEPVFKKTEEFIITLSRQIARSTGMPAHLLCCLTNEEVGDYFATGTMPTREVLEERDRTSAFVFDGAGRVVYVGKDAAMIEALITPTVADAVQGTVAFPGKAQGAVRIILDPAKAEHFSEGDILVTGMTRPEYLPVMKKAAAIVTDSGGVLCHAAIVAREMKKPCVINTKNATKVLKDGDKVEVDA